MGMGQKHVGKEGQATGSRRAWPVAVALTENSPVPGNFPPQCTNAPPSGSGGSSSSPGVRGLEVGGILCWEKTECRFPSDCARGICWNKTGKGGREANTPGVLTLVFLDPRKAAVAAAAVAVAAAVAAVAVVAAVAAVVAAVAAVAAVVAVAMAAAAAVEAVAAVTGPAG